MNECKYCGEKRRDHDFSGLCKNHENFYDNGEEDREELKQRRERIATAAMQGILSNPALVGPNGVCRDVEVEAIMQADALIKALDEVKE